MNRPQRRRHFRLWLLLGPVLIGGLVFVILNRAPLVSQPGLEDLRQPADQGGTR